MSLPSYIARTLLIILFLFPVVVPLSDAKADDQGHTKTVVVIGASTIYKNDSASAREAAISSSLISAVNMATMEILPIESVVRNFTIINKILYSKTGEFVQGYKVLTEFPSEKTYRVMVQATVSISVLEKKLSEAGIVVRQKALPKVLFLVAEQRLQDNFLNYWWRKDSAFFKAVAETSLTETLTAEGFSIINHDGIMGKEGLDAVYDRPDLNNQQVEALGNRFQAEVVVVGTSTASKMTNIMGTNIKSFKGTVMARAIRTDTGAQVASTTQSAVTANSDEIVGGREALSAAGVLAGKELASQIAAAWQKEDKQANMLEIMLEGTGNLANFVKFRNMLKDLPGVREMQIKEMKPDQAIIVVSFQGNAKKLADALILKTFESVGINIYEVSEDHLRIQLIPG
ncbi:MAG: hypothetical protein ABIK98_01040 [Pseudomonadota bacterium]|uniref:Flagellar assembly protein T N-terminal domain-containing protein n=1 Tax=Candidatus Desulfatibia profunda TaxID=2841695 RepID=A0A8J6NWW1_9BACT|nr:hypothetical protein [Candidatus Desulfatibia profunda]MBL7180517.1 hypothetical protein [Desulfobacterales bacterium]MBU0699252.1 hypothetical protein [Pseudomonadota bacterium]